MSAVTAAKDIWKLAPSTASGRTSATATAAQATRRMVKAERSVSTASMTIAVMRKARWVGTVAPAKSTYAAVAMSAATAATFLAGMRSASQGTSAIPARNPNSRIAAMRPICSPEIESRWARPESRIASMMSVGIAP
jgi:hypothetical protein